MSETLSPKEDVMKTKEKVVRINSVDFVIVSFLIKLDSIMTKSCIAEEWNKSKLWRYSFNRCTPIPRESEERFTEGFKIRLSTWKNASFINLVMKRDPVYGWQILLGYMHNESFGIYNDFHFRCDFFGSNLIILPRKPKETECFTFNKIAENDFIKHIPSEDLVRCIK